VYAAVWNINDRRLTTRLTDTQRSTAVVSHIDVTRDGRYVIAVESCHGHVITPDHVIIRGVNSGQVLFDVTTESNVVQLTTTADSDKVRGPLTCTVYINVTVVLCVHRTRCDRTNN